jgi:small subunit ribosomal protein S1
VLKRDDKGATFQMPHGLEAFGPAKHIRKEDNSVVEPGETVTVKVIEFNKDDRRILVSHSRYLEDLKNKAEAVVRAERAKEEGENQSAIADVQKKVEKETLGDLAALAALKQSAREVILPQYFDNSEPFRFFSGWLASFYAFLFAILPLFTAMCNPAMIDYL